MGNKVNQNLTVVITAYNNQDTIADAVENAKLLTDNVTVVDIGSVDKTADFAGKAGANILALPFTSYVEPVRETSIKNAATDWVLVLDSDERVTDDLVQEIKKTIVRGDFTYYKIPRKNIFGNKKWLKYGAWWPDYQIRLINRNFFVNWPKEIHSTPVIKGEVGLLNNPLLHYFHGDIESMVKKTIVFENIESDLLLRNNKPASTITFFRKYLGELNRRLFMGLGFMDGIIGIIEAIYQAFSKTITYLYLYEKKNSRSI